MVSKKVSQEAFQLGFPGNKLGRTEWIGLGGDGLSALTPSTRNHGPLWKMGRFVWKVGLGVRRNLAP